MALGAQMASQKTWRNIAILAILLFVLSNLFWIVVVIDAGHLVSDVSSLNNLNDAALDEAIQLLVRTNPNITKDELIPIAESISERESFVKNDCVWVGNLGFMFDRAEKLVHVARAWSFGEADPCYAN